MAMAMRSDCRMHCMPRMMMMMDNWAVFLPLRMGIDVGQRLENRHWSGRRSGQEIAMRMIAMLIRRIGYLHGQALLRGEVILAMHLVLIANLSGSDTIG
ncbi:hypothetical protein M5D96_007601 [Drosophila gunungcola]|uniref:Uncharacterized protein n=1 Tax=Drosophila gunungcola TaxID=103775 RepID=A0A9P9YNI1_9MUSC|nr:hypothetical protein M5D96_007601 [Drosophila gunungcola]